MISNNLFSVLAESTPSLFLQVFVVVMVVLVII